MRVIGFLSLVGMGIVGVACSGSTNDAGNGGFTNPTGDDASTSGDDTTVADGGKPKNDGGTTNPTDGGGGGTDSGVDAGPFFPASHPGFPQVPNNGGGVLNPMKLVTVVASADTLKSDLLAFGDDLIASDWWKTLATEYALGTPSKHVKVTSSATMPNPISETGMKSYITAAINGNADAQPDGNTMYILYLPGGIDDIDPQSGNTNTDCSVGYAGYHETYGNGGDAWGFSRHCSGSGMSALAQVTLGASHEIIEAATDPDPASPTWTMGFAGSKPWNSSVWAAIPGGSEIGDLCASQEIALGVNSYTYQRIWSNTTAASGGDPCVPATGKPYYNASAANDWYPMSGSTLHIPIKGWSTARIADWAVLPSVIAQKKGTFTAGISGATSQTIGSTKVDVINNGDTVTLDVTVSGAGSGSWAIIEVASEALTSGVDAFHVWPVGVYVP